MRHFPTLFRNEILLKDFDSLFKPFTMEVNSPWKSKENKYKLSVDLPGLKKEDISLEIEDDFLLISGKREFETENGSSYKEYKFSTSIPNDLNIELLDANYENGVLVLTSEKLVDAKNKKVIKLK